MYAAEPGRKICGVGVASPRKRFFAMASLSNTMFMARRTSTLPRAGIFLPRWSVSRSRATSLGCIWIFSPDDLAWLYVACVMREPSICPVLSALIVAVSLGVTFSTSFLYGNDLASQYASFLTKV